MDLPGYSRDDAISISIRGRNTNRSTKGTAHYNASQVQNTASVRGTLASETVVAFNALRAAGLGPAEAKYAVLRAREYLKELGGNAGTRTNVPKKRRK
jgi:hypothetical protein